MKISSRAVKAAFLGALIFSGAAQAITYQFRFPSQGLVGLGTTPVAPPPVLAGAVGTLTAVTSADFGSVTLNSTASRSFKFNNTGDAAAAGVYASIPAVTGLSLSASSCGTLASPVSVAAGGSCSLTLAYGGSTASSLADSSLTVTGAFNGTPASLALSGAIGGFNAAAAWSSSTASVVAPTPATLDFGVKTTGTTTSKTLYLKNTGTSGAQVVGYTVTGDTSQFTLMPLTIVRNGNITEYACVTTPSVISGASASPCQAEDATALYSIINATFKYTPKVIGAHSLTITPMTKNGTALPGAVTLTGQGAFNPAAAWSTVTTSVIAPTAAAIDFGVKTTGTMTSKVFYLQNTGTNGALSVGYAVTGDTSQFTLVALREARSGGSTEYACEVGGTVSGTSATPCVAQDVATAAYSIVSVEVRYTPKATGSHSLTITPTTNNGTTLPSAITLTGQGAFNPAAAWSSSTASVVAPTAATLDFGAKTTGTTTSKTIYLKNTGTNGALVVGYTVTGDTSQFTLMPLTIVRNGSVTEYSCVSTASVISGTSATPCQAEDASALYSIINATFKYTPKAAGTHSLTITPTTTNGTALPGAITLTGTGQ